MPVPKTHLHFFLSEFRSLIFSTYFLLMTVLGNLLIGISGFLFFLLEHGKNQQVNRYLDAVWWAFATATTTGYGDITPKTDAGKILSVLVMLGGLALFAMYTALFAETILTSKKAFHEFLREKDKR